MDQAVTFDDEPGTAPLFSALAVRLVYCAIALVGIGVLYARITHRAELLRPIDPDLEAAAIGLGVFAGILLDAVILAGRAQGVALARPMAAWRLLLTLAAVPAIAAMGATYGARRIVEQRAFDGLPVETVPQSFTITARHSGRSGHSLSVSGGAGERSIDLGVGSDVYYAAHVGDHVTLPVQTGRGGVQRMFPRALRPGDLLAADGSTAGPPAS